MSTDLKTSLQVAFNLPEFVRDENPNFVAFMEAYYEFLEQSSGNDITTVSKTMRYLSDTDESMAMFEQNFFETYLALIPRDVALDKSTLVKNILPLYQSKGTPKAFKFLFRLLFNEEVELILPKNDILRTSDGKWLIENILRVLFSSVYSLHTGDGSKKIFRLPQSATPDELTVTINGVLTTDYTVQTEYKKLTFTTAPIADAVIKIAYQNFDSMLAVNRKVIGQTSGATAIVERTTRTSVAGQDAVLFFINSKNLVGTFENGEQIEFNVLDDDGNSISIYSKSLSIVKSIAVTDGGAGYNVGDPTIISAGGSTQSAAAVVGSVYKGLINRVLIENGGAGFQDGATIEVYGTANAILSMAVAGVDTSGNVTANSLQVYTDTIGNYASTLISASNYGFPATKIASENVYTTIADALSVSRYVNIGPISNVQILTSLAPLDYVPELNATGAIILENNNIVAPINTYGALGRFNIITGGTGYQIGDEVQFTNKPMNFGIGAAAAVTKVAANGAIEKLEFQPWRIDGTANISSPSNVTIIGTGTNFTGQLRVGDKIMINSEVSFVNVIHSATSLNVNTNFTHSTTAKKVGAFGRRVIGGQGYTEDKLPDVIVISTTGTLANIAVSTIMGDGEHLTPKGNTQPGQIERIDVVSGGEGYVAAPVVDLSMIGDGTARAIATLETPYITLPGKWTTSDGLLSSSDSKVQGRNYYHDYSYVISAQVEFTKYKQIVKELLHPAGFAFYSEYAKLDEVQTTLDSARLIINTELAGTVNVGAGSTIIYGSNTKFNIANLNYVLIPGATIAVDAEIRTVGAIIDNTTITVTEAFSNNANVQSIVVISVPYNGLGTEDLLEITTENDFVIRV